MEQYLKDPGFSSDCNNCQIDDQVQENSVNDKL